MLQPTSLLKTHVYPAIGHHQLTHPSPVHIEAFYGRALESGRADGKGGLSRESVLLLHRVCHVAFKRAVRLGLVVSSPFDSVQPPRFPRRQTRVLGGVELAALLAAVAGTPIHLPVLIAATTGARRGEVLALQWKDVALDARQIEIARSLQETTAGLAFKEPKTGRGWAVAVPDITIQLLRAHKAEQAEAMLLLGETRQAERLVCCWPDGTPIQPGYVTHAFMKAQDKLGMAPVRFHDLRHGYPSLLLGAGEDMKVVSEVLGHVDIRTTYNIYSHVNAEMQKKAARRVDEILRSAANDR